MCFILFYLFLFIGFVMPHGEMRGGILCKAGEGDRIKGILMKG